MLSITELIWREKTAGPGRWHRAVAESYLLGIFFELLGPCPALLRPPLTHPLVVTGDEYIGYPPASIRRWTGVVRVLRRSLQHPAERLLDGALLVPEGAGMLAHQDIGDDHRWQLAAGQYVAADRDLVVDKMLVHPLIEPLVAPTEKRHVVLLG